MSEHREHEGLDAYADGLCAYCLSENLTRMRQERDGLVATISQALVEAKGAVQGDANALDIIRALESSPTKSLAEHDAAIWEEAAKIAEIEPCEGHHHGHKCAEYIAEELREKAEESRAGGRK